MSEDSKILLKYASNEKSKYDEVYNYIMNNVIEPKRNTFINQEVLFTNVKQLYKRAAALEAIIKEISKEE